MSAKPKAPISARDVRLQLRLRVAGALVLFAGLGVAALVSVQAAPDDPSLDAQQKVYDYQMEMIGGKSNVMAADFREWFAGLWHGQNLAHTLAFLSLGGSLGCFLVAHRLNYAPRATPPPGGAATPPDRAP